LSSKGYHWNKPERLDEPLGRQMNKNKWMKESFFPSTQDESLMADLPVCQ
jgi:hypothetical protein